MTSICMHTTTHTFTSNITGHNKLFLVCSQSCRRLCRVPPNSGVTQANPKVQKSPPPLLLLSWGLARKLPGPYASNHPENQNVRLQVTKAPLMANHSPPKPKNPRPNPRTRGSGGPRGGKGGSAAGGCGSGVQVRRRRPCPSPTAGRGRGPPPRRRRPGPRTRCGRRRSHG